MLSLLLYTQHGKSMAKSNTGVYIQRLSTWEESFASLKLQQKTIV
jgi:hypothetical protein